MSNTSTFQIYNASAGSGKTFSLVKEYLKIVLKSTSPYAFQHILAVTFTNKASGEMKERILENLHSFAERKETDMLPMICEELQISKEEVFEKSEVILRAILQNYSAFSVTTIDSFTHKLIRTFAYDLGLSLTFDVEMDTEDLLQEAIDKIISEIGEDKAMTQMLISYALQKADDDKTWDISYDLLNFSKLLLNENHTIALNKLKKVDFEDFTTLRTALYANNAKNNREFKEIGEKALQLISDNGLSFSDFLRGTLPKHFELLINSPSKASFFDKSTLKKAVEEQQFYKKTASQEVKNTIDSIAPKLTEYYLDAEKVYQRKVRNDLMLESLVPLAVLRYIYKAINDLKEERNIMLNAEFNDLIYKTIKDEPAPFIYERLGEKYRHYFIDEMQDTSVLQWQNVIPLLAHALTSENAKGEVGSLLLVGDAKQSIYRWRGGKAEQFIALSSEKETEESNPFGVPKKVQNLGVNFRSYSEVIDFNNQFFSYLSSFLSNEEYARLFKESNRQKTNHRKGGYVEVSFVEKDKDDDEKDLVFAKKTAETIKRLDKSFQRGEICVLVRSNKQGVDIANYLTEQGIDIVSSDTLLLNNSPKIRVIIHLLQLAQNTDSQESKIKILYFLHSHCKVAIKMHSFIKEYLELPVSEMFSRLENIGISFSLSRFLEMPFYESIEYIVQSFHLASEPESEIQFFLDIVFERSQKKDFSLSDFLAFWELKKDSLSVIASEMSHSVKITTIHKAKGLEFPVVIFPYDLNIYQEKDGKVWYDMEEDFTINPMLLPYKKSLNYISEQGQFLYQQRQEELELDNFNLLYVAMTRAVEQLYIIQDKKLNAKQEENIKYSSGLFIRFLKDHNKWEDEKDTYSFGNEERISVLKEKKDTTKEIQTLVHCSWKKHQVKIAKSALLLEDGTKEKAMFEGTQLHQILEKIKTISDVEKVVKQLKFNGATSKEKSNSVEKILHNIVSHSELKEYFSEDVSVINERKIATSNGENLIPDRLVFEGNKVTIIDYKTGEFHKEYAQQLNNYEKALSELGYTVEKKLLVYIQGVEVSVVKV